MATLSLASHPYCLRCGTMVPAMFDPGTQYDGHIYHLSCATKTILEKALMPAPPPRSDLSDDSTKHPRF